MAAACLSATNFNPSTSSINALTVSVCVYVARELQRKTEKRRMEAVVDLEHHSAPLLANNQSIAHRLSQQQRHSAG